MKWDKVCQLKKSSTEDFPGGPVVKDPPSDAGNAGSIPGRGTKIPYAVGQLSPCPATTEPVCSRACAPQLERSTCATTREKHIRHNERSCMLQ